MGETVKAFDALVLAGVAAVLGTVFLVGAMIGLLSGGDSITLVLADSVVASTVVGVLLLLTGGALGTDNEFLDWVETAVPARAVIPALEELFAAYTEERNEGERFYAWCRQVENDRLRTIMQRADAPVSAGVAQETGGRGSSDD